MCARAMKRCVAVTATSPDVGVFICVRSSDVSCDEAPYYRRIYGEYGARGEASCSSSGIDSRSRDFGDERYRGEYENIRECFA